MEKNYLISYRTYDGTVTTITKKGHNLQYVVNQLVNCREIIYWEEVIDHKTEKEVEETQ